MHNRGTPIPLLFAIIALTSGCRPPALSFGSPQQIASILLLGTDAEQKRLKDSLRMPWLLDADCRREAAGPCGVKVENAVLEEGKENAVLEVKSFEDFLIIALVRGGNGTWQSLGLIPLDTTYDALSVDIQSILAPPVQEILVHGHIHLHGSGIYQANSLVLKVVDGRLQVVLNTVEASHVTQGWTGQTGRPDLEERSVFEIVPNTAERKGYLRETRVSVRGNQRSLGQRSFGWNDHFRTFEPSLWLLDDPMPPSKLALYPDDKPRR